MALTKSEIRQRKNIAISGHNWRISGLDIYQSG